MRLQVSSWLGFAGFCAGAVALCFLARPGVASGYTVSSPIGSGCHEAITSEALRRVRVELPTAAPLPPTDDEQALIDDVDYQASPDMKDLGATALLLGVRDNDVKGLASIDLTNLALVHGDPSTQAEQCLRGTDDEEPNGSQTALEDCRTYILTRVDEALAGLDEGATPDPRSRVVLPVYLQLRHDVDAPLPTYYVRMGQALHALEDSYSHTYRAADGGVTAVLNWVRQVDGTWVESRDGPPHASGLDRCDDPDALRAEYHARAIDAATDLLRVTLTPGQDRESRAAAVNAVLDTHLSSTPGCTFDNGWCDAPERNYETGYDLGCSVGRIGSSPRASLLILALVVPAVCFRRRRGMMAALACLLVAGVASAQSQVNAETTPATSAVTADPPHEPVALIPGAVLDGAVSSDHAAFAIAGGFRLRIGTRFAVGADLEWNPFITYNGVSVRAGVLNAYATAILRIPLANQRFDLRSTLHIGMSRMLFALYGVPSGSTGLFLGLDPLGLEWKVTQRACVVINPLGVALPAPQLSGVPYTYLQYRVTVAVEVYTR